MIKAAIQIPLLPELLLREDFYSYHCVSNTLTITYHTVGCFGWGVVVLVEEELVLLRQGEAEVLRTR